MAPATDDADPADFDASGSCLKAEAVDVERSRAAHARIGQVIDGNYRIVRYIGSGGSSHVFQAEHLRLGKSFALKLLREGLDSSSRAAQRFRREAKAIARLNSEHIVSVVDCGELDDSVPYLVMELLEGEDLRSLLDREGALPARRALHVVLEACRGLTVVHEAGLVHRDLKPENLFITRRATGEDWCKVLDFGIAKMEASISTAQGAIVGTVRYMAPEQLADGATVGPATDVYALGAILYECLSGRALVSGATVQEVMYHVMNVAPVPLGRLVSTLPGTLAAIVDLCVDKAPTKRPASAAALAKLLRDELATPPLPTLSNATLREDELFAPLSVAKQARKTGFGRFATGVVGGALAAGVLGWGLRGALSRTNERERHLELAARMPRAASVAKPVVEEPPKPAATAAISAVPAVVSAGHKTTHVAARAQPSGSVAASATAAPTAASRFDNTNPYGE